MQIILLVKHQHRFFVINGINRAKRQRTITIIYQQRIAHQTCRTFIAIHKWLDITVNNNRKVYQIVIEKYTTSIVLQKYKKFGYTSVVIECFSLLIRFTSLFRVVPI